MKIGIDIDEVLCETMKGFSEYYNKNYGGDLSFDDFLEYSVYKTLEIEHEEGHKLLDEYILHSDFENIELVEGVKDCLPILFEGHELVFISARPNFCMNITLNFFKKHFPKFNHKVIFSGDAYKEQGKTKDEICQEIGVDVLVEDSGHSQDYAEKGLKVVLLDKPWNQGVEHENIHRVNNWEEVLNKIKEFENE